MSIARSAAATALAAAAFTILTLMPTAGPALLDDPPGLLAWWERHGTAAATIGVMHLVALAAAAYVALVLAAITVAGALRLPTAAATLARLAPSTIRRALAVGVVAGTLAAPSTAVGQEPIVVVDVGADAVVAAPITVTDLGEARPEASDDAPAATDLPATSTFRESFRAKTQAPAPDAWLVETGDNLWTIAASVLDDHRDATADDARVADYWRRLIAANDAVITDPDLIFPGQVLNLPPVVTAGS